MNMKKQTIKRLFSIIGKYKPMLLLTILLALVFVVVSLYIPILVGDAVDVIVDKGNVNFELLIPILVKIAIIALLEASMNRTSQLLLKPNLRRNKGIIRPTNEVMGPVNQPKIPAKFSSLSPERYI